MARIYITRQQDIIIFFAAQDEDDDEADGDEDDEDDDEDDEEEVPDRKIASFKLVCTELSFLGPARQTGGFQEKTCARGVASRKHASQ